MMLSHALPRVVPPLGLAEIALTQLLIFVALPLVVSLPAGRRALPAIFRLRPVGPDLIGKSVLMAALGWVAVQGLSLLPLYLVSRLGGEPPNPYQPLLDQPLPRWALAGAIVLVPALAEEFAFRGFLLSGYGELGSPRAWVWTGLLFGLAHMSLLRLPALAALGMVLSYVALRTGSILPTVVMHGLHNGITLGVYFLSRSAVPAGEMPTEVPLGMVLLWTAAALVALPALVAVARSLPRYPDPLVPWADGQATASGQVRVGGRSAEVGAGGSDGQDAADGWSMQGGAGGSDSQAGTGGPAGSLPGRDPGAWLSRWWPLAAVLLIYASYVAGELAMTFDR
nr:MAG: hypothetical protein DIU70_11495 [Bacillota bacterium]